MIVLALIVLVAMACTTAPTVPAARAAPGLASSALTSQERCVLIIVALCSREERCGGPTTRECAIDNGVHLCSSALGIDEEEAAACVDAILHGTCGAPVPQACFGLAYEAPHVGRGA